LEALFVGDLSYFCSDSDLQRTFQPYGPVHKAVVRKSFKTNEPLHYGFVEIPIHNANRAIQELNGEMLLGRKLRIGIYKTKMEDYHNQLISLHVSFLSRLTNFTVNETFLRQEFSQFGEVQDCVVKQYCCSPASGSPRQYGYAFIYYADMPSAQRALDHLHRESLMNSVKYACNLSHNEHFHSQHHFQTPSPPSTHSPCNPSIPQAPPLQLQASLPPNVVMSQLPAQTTHSRNPNFDSLQMSSAVSNSIPILQVPSLLVAYPSIPMHTSTHWQAATPSNSFHSSHPLGHPHHSHSHSSLPMASSSMDSSVHSSHSNPSNSPVPVPSQYCYSQNAHAMNPSAGYGYHQPVPSPPISSQAACEYPTIMGPHQGIFLYAAPSPSVATTADAFIANSIPMAVAAVPISMLPPNPLPYPTMTGEFSNHSINHRQYATSMHSHPQQQHPQQQHPQQQHPQHSNSFYLR
jgi:RNA recognition motif-containing protein